jgi:hypothetical protein
MDDAQLYDIAAQILAACDEAVTDALMEPLTFEEARVVCDAIETETRRREAEYRWFAAWVERERAKGRPEAEMTWGRCVRETGILKRGGLRAQ